MKTVNDANIGDEVTYKKWYADKRNPEGRIGNIITFDESGREGTYVLVRWEDRSEDWVQGDGLKLVKKKKTK